MRFVNQVVQNFYIGQQRVGERGMSPKGRSPDDIGGKTAPLKREMGSSLQSNTANQLTLHGKKPQRKIQKLNNFKHRPARCASTMTTGLQIQSLAKKSFTPAPPLPPQTNVDLLMNLKDGGVNTSSFVKESLNTEFFASLNQASFKNQVIQLQK